MILKIYWRMVLTGLFCLTISITKAQLHIEKTSAASCRGSFLFITSASGMSKSELKYARHLNELGFDLALFRGNSRNMLGETLRLLQGRSAGPGLRGPRIGIIAIGAGAGLAAELVYQLAPAQQPDDLVLLNPDSLSRTIPGTVIPAFIPPVSPRSRLLTIVPGRASNPFGEYTKTWKGYDGEASLRLVSDSADPRPIIDSFLNTASASAVTDNAPGTAPASLVIDSTSTAPARAIIDTAATASARKVFKAAATAPAGKVTDSAPGTAPVSLVIDSSATAPARAIIDTAATASARMISDAHNPARIAVPGWGLQRHADKLALMAKEKFDLLMIGNSITHNFEKPEYQAVWNQFFAPRKAINLGYSGYRTENILWNIQHGELDGQSPKAVILEIGTNNIDEKNFPTRHTAGQLAGGIAAIVNTIRQKLPDTKILVLRSFPGCYGGPNPTSHRAILDRASELVSRLADGQHIFYCDINYVFLNFDGRIRHELMPDWLHPNAAGAKAWARAMEPLLAQLMGDSSLDHEMPANTAIVPATRLEEDSYNWWDRHHEVLRIKDSIDPQIVLIGNSITHYWGGLPARLDVKGLPRQSNGQRSWDSLFAGYRVLNLGFGWDRTQNVLWRLDHGELDGLHPRVVVIDIGTNNTSQTDHARMNTAEEIAEGVRAVCERVRSKIPNTRIILMGIFPREQSPAHPRRILIDETNRLLRSFAQQEMLTFVDIGPQFLAPAGTMLPGVTSDFCHPTEEGYTIWANALRPLIRL